jgi:hypothetical protein
LKEIAATIKLSQHSFFWPHLGTFWKNLVINSTADSQLQLRVF